LVSSGHCIVCPSIYGYWLPFGILYLQLLITLWYLLAILLSDLRFTATDYPLVSSHFWPLYYLSFDLWLLITPLVSSGHCIVCPSIYGYWLPFDIFWPLHCLSFDLRLLITLWYLRFTATDYPLVSSGHFIVCPSIYVYWLPFGIFWPFHCLSFDLRLLITLWKGNQ
jgi:hypothetical protein